MGNARNHDPRHVCASQRLARARGRLPRRSGVYAHGNFASPALPTSGEQFPVALRVHEFWYDRGRHRSGESVRIGMGRGVQTKIIQPAWDEFDQLALCGFYRAQEQSIGACAGRWQMDAKVQTRSRSAITDGWGEFVGE